MGLEQIKSEIIGKAEKKAQKIIKDAKKQAAEIQKEADKEISEYKDKKLNQKQKAMDDYKRLSESGIEFDKKSLNLSMKKDILDKAKIQTQKKLKDLKKSERKKHIRKLIKKAENDISVDKVICSAQDKSVIEKKTDVKDLSGGIIAVNKDSTIRIDYSYDNILGQVFQDNLNKLSDILFR
ncbi:hypothetical protein GF327_04905 [Candidatus Woesearchaeota archaeon]|nr:hypothetical protein [Candidatus Woesearchaeota archaeon]